MIVFFFQKDDITIHFRFSPSSDVILMQNIENFKLLYLFTLKRAGKFEFEIELESNVEKIRRFLNYF